MIPGRHVKVIARWGATDLIVLRLFCILYLIRVRQILLFHKFATEHFDSLAEPATNCHNHLGSGALVTDSAGNEVFRITYTEYGEIDLANSGKYNPATGEIEHHLDDVLIAITAVKYTGQEYDPETGFYYYNARYYDPQLGVFTTPDKKFDKNAGSFGFNRHMYVAGNPIMYSDPSGHFAFLIPALVVLGKIAAGAATGALIGGTVSATIRAAQHGWDFKNNWNSIGEAFVTGAAIGAITGAAGVVGGMVGNAAANGAQSAFGQTFARHFIGKLTTNILAGGGIAAYRGENILEGMGRGFASGYVGDVANGLGFGAINHFDTDLGGTLASSAIDGTLQFGASVATQSMLNPNAKLDYGAMLASSYGMALGRGFMRAFTYKYMGAKFEDNKRLSFGTGHRRSALYVDAVNEQGANSIAAQYRTLYTAGKNFNNDFFSSYEGGPSMDAAAMAGGNGISQIHDAINSAAVLSNSQGYMEALNIPFMFPAVAIAQHMHRGSYLNLSREFGY
jgi:RHS repeat-associated protein